MAQILAVHAHPDDVEILAGGTVALLAAAGHAVTIATMTPGDCGASDLNADAIATVRRKEAATAAARIGATYICAELRDLAIFNDHATRRKVTELLRQTQPDLILTSSPVDYLCDHEATSALVRDACFAAPAPNYATGAVEPAPALAAIPHLYWMDPLGGVDREERPILPEIVVNVEAVLAQKMTMLTDHASQRNWLRRHHGTDDYMEQAERWTAERGRLAGFKYGEGFRQYRSSVPTNAATATVTRYGSVGQNRRLAKRVRIG